MFESWSLCEMVCRSAFSSGVKCPNSKLVQSPFHLVYVVGGGILEHYLVVR